MATVELSHITKKFGSVVALNDVSFTVKDGEFFVLLGQTGAGKTTTLRVIAGLEKQNAGDVFFDGVPVNDATPAERDTAFVFQYYSLYPTMSVYDNLAFPLRAPGRNLSEAEIKQRVHEAAERVRITHLLQRSTRNLSGGEMQRVAIGRALVRRPRIFLMDEPLSNLDAKLREALRIELNRLQREAHSTTLFVTHDQIEAMTLADRVGVLRDGVLVQVGTPREIYDFPATTFVAKLVGVPRINLYDAVRTDGKIRVPDSTIELAAPPHAALPESFTLGFRPEDVQIGPDGDLTGQISLLEPLGVETIVHIRSGRHSLLSTVSGIADFSIGSEVRYRIVRERLHFFDRKTGHRLSLN
ncbi:MAG: ABC transporter ATP-binding protein [Thermoflexales bacterium]|nr:ABC transporter ATP-binding protein [Thermoflexales bacterium]MDW8352316.1 ABC transporter ATP-binding protein [Anaerolineae bacterium]